MTRTDHADESRVEPTDGSPITVLFAGEDPPSGPSADSLDADDRFEVTRSVDFVDAMELVDRRGVDCVVATAVEGGFDGVGFLESVRQGHDELPVVILAAAVDADDARRAVAADATALVPVTDANALERVGDAIASNVVTSDDRTGTRMPISDLTVEAERRLKERALDEAPIGITISDANDPDEPIIYINDSFEAITGYPPEEAVGVNHRFLQGPDTDPDRVAEVADAISEERGIQTVLRNYTRDGEEFWNQIRISPIFDDQGEVSHFVGFQMDVTERRRAQRELLEERESLDRLLDRVNGLINDVTGALVRAQTRGEIERLVTERLGDGGEYTAAWLGRYDEAASQVRIAERAGEGAGETNSIDVEGETDAARVFREVVERQAVREVGDPGELFGGAPEGTCVLVPVPYRSTTYGVIGVIDDEGLIDGRERVVLESLGRSVGVSINDVLTKRTITTDTVLNIGVQLSDDDILLTKLAADLDTHFDHEATIADDQGPGVVTIVSTPFDDTEALAEHASDYDAVVSVEPLVESADETVVQFRLSSSPLVDVLSEAGSRVTSLRADSRTLDVEFRVGTERAARRVLDALRGEYDHVDLLAYHEDKPEQPSQGFREDVRGDLTDRQLTALKKAHVGGYFEWPRRAEGEQLAESMDIVPSTYHQHLQAAKRKLVSAFFEE